MNVVRWRSSGCSGTLWYPFQASKTVFFLLWGTERAWWIGDCVWCVSRVACLLRAWKSTVRLGVPSFLAQTTILWHQVTGSPMGTGSSTPRDTSLFNPAFTSSHQWMGTGIALWWATGWASGSTIILIHGESIMGSGWWGHLLKVEAP